MADRRNQINALMQKGFSRAEIDELMAEEDARADQLRANITGHQRAIDRISAEKGPSLLGEIGKAAGALGTDFLNTISFGGYQKVRDASGELAEEAGLIPRGTVERARGGEVEARSSDPGQFASNTMKALGYTAGLPRMAAQAGMNAAGIVGLGASRVMGPAFAGGTGGFLTGAGEATVAGATPLETLEQGAKAGVAGAVTGGLIAEHANVGNSAANSIRNSPSAVGQDIRLLERMGAEPSPVPFRPVKNPPSKQLGVTASSEGRGELGERGARQLTTEVAAQDRALSQRLNNVEMPAAVAKQGDRSLSVQKYIDTIDGRLADPSVEMIPGLKGQLEKARAVLTGEMEASADLFSLRQMPVAGARDMQGARLGGKRIHVTAPEDYVPRVGGRAAMKGEQSIGDLAREHYAGGPNRQTAVIRADDPELAELRRSEPISVGLGVLDEQGLPVGDIRGRVGDAPNYVMNASKLNRVRDLLDDAAGISSKETGLSKKDHELAKLANEMRGDIRREAPAMGLANRRYAAGKRKLEATGDRMKTDNSESLGMQIASLGEEGSKQAGARKVRLGELKDQFPVTDTLGSRDVQDVFDNPRALLAEERMGLKKLPRIGGGGDDVWNLRGPLIGRGVYPAAQEAARTESLTPSLRLQDELRPGLAADALPGIGALTTQNPVLRAMLFERERQRRLADRVKSGGKR